MALVGTLTTSATVVGAMAAGDITSSGGGGSGSGAMSTYRRIFVIDV